MGAWDEHYAHLVEPEPYGDDLSYRLAAHWTRGCRTIEDWGCGKGWLRRFVEPDAYVGIDSSATPFADVTADLTTYRSQAEGIVARHVLEHNYAWAQILDNALASFIRRLIVVVFTPPQPETVVLMTEPEYHDVPVIGFRLGDLTERFTAAGVRYNVSFAYTATFYGYETTIRAWRDDGEDDVRGPHGLGLPGSVGPAVPG